MSRYQLFVGSYTAKSAEKLGGGKGIYMCRFDGRHSIAPVWLSTDCADPSFLAVKGNLLYAAEEQRESTLGAYAISHTGLKRIQTLALHQLDTCHIQLTPDNHYICAANYGSGSLSLIRLKPDGRLGELTCTAAHQGHSIHPRQTAPRVHSTCNSPDGKHLLAADLGTDTITVYSITASGTLKKQPGMGTRVPPGRGPRHMAFSPDGTRLCVVCEISSTLLVLPYDAQSGIGSLLEERSLLPPGSADGAKAADIHFSPDGRYLYASVRGTDSIVMMPYCAGTLGGMTFFPACGESPRHFCITEDGRFLITANEHSGSIAVISRDTETGMLGACVAAMEIPRAVFVTSVQEE